MPTKNIFLCFIFLIAFQLNSTAQRENTLWFFGPTDRGIKFDPVTLQPSVITGKVSPYGAEGCSIVNNPVTGDLIYYSDGIRAIDATNSIMPNGDNLLGNSSAAQNGWSCPVPGSCNRYYLFSNGSTFESATNKKIYYSIVNMELAGNGTTEAPLGDIEAGAKNILLADDVSEAMTIVKGSVKDVYWIILHSNNSSNLQVFKISTSGITHELTFDTGYQIRDGRSIRYSEEAGKLSVIGLHGLDPLLIIDFDNSTGTLSNPYVIPGTPFYNLNISYYGVYDSEWSEDGSKLYITLYRWHFTSTGGRIYQYDLNKPDEAPVLIFDNNGNTTHSGRGIKRGPDGKIYWIYQNSTHNSTRYIGIINNPNEPGAACNFDPLGLDMGESLGNAHKFPEILVYTNQPPVVQDDTILTCIKEKTNINILDNDNEPEGDPINVSILSVVHGNAVLLHDNSIEYTPSNSTYTQDEIYYQVCDQGCYSFCKTGKVGISICDPLPVKFVQFEVEPANGNVLLSWSTSSEINSQYFDIQRSVDGISFESVAHIKARGFSDAISQYQFIDDTPVSGTSYYQIRAFDSDGIFDKTAILSITISQSTYHVSPNPSEGSFTITTHRNAIGTSINVTDILGKVVYKAKIDEFEGTSFEIDLSLLSKGIYFINIQNGNELTKLKVLKN